MALTSPDSRCRVSDPAKHAFSVEESDEEAAEDETGAVIGAALVDVEGDLLADMDGDAAGDVLTDVEGDLLADVDGDVAGDVLVGVDGDAAGDVLVGVDGDVYPDAEYFIEPKSSIALQVFNEISTVVEVPEQVKSVSPL